MSDNLDQPEGAIKRNFMDESDVEGHSIRRDGEGNARREAEGEGNARRQAFPDDSSDDVEGHSMVRGDDGAIRRDDEGFTRRVVPGEGHTSRH